MIPSPSLPGFGLGEEQDSIIPSDYDVNIKFSLLQDDRGFLEFHNARIPISKK